MSFIAQERSDIASDGIAQTHDNRVLGRVNEHVELVGLEAAKQTNLRRIGRKAILAGRAAAKGPLIGRNWSHRALIADLVANRQDRMRGIGVSGRIRAKAGATFERKGEGSIRRDR